MEIHRRPRNDRLGHFRPLRIVFPQPARNRINPATFTPPPALPQARLTPCLNACSIHSSGIVDGDVSLATLRHLSYRTPEKKGSLRA
jgi:hypothetical protein